MRKRKTFQFLFLLLLYKHTHSSLVKLVVKPFSEFIANIETENNNNKKFLNAYHVNDAIYFHQCRYNMPKNGELKVLLVFLSFHAESNKRFTWTRFFSLCIEIDAFSYFYSATDELS